MRKNELIKLLTHIKGNPEVMLWNGYVGDYMKISKDLVSSTLVKQSSDFVRDHVNMEHLRDGKPPITEEELKRCMKAHYSDWEMPNEFVLESEMDRWYGKARKTIIVMQSETRGKTSWDRSGSIDY
jgi:hypothetical protein